MSLWSWILLASAAAFATKFAGYLVPARLLERPRMLQVAATLTIGLLAALTAVNAVADGQALVLDARLAALLAAGAALLVRLPFIAVVIAGAGASALARMAGLG